MSTTRRVGALALAFASLAACSSTSITDTGGGTYMVGVRRAQAGFGPSPKAAATVYEKANAFCAQKGLKMERVELRQQESGFGRPASAVLEFRCVNPVEEENDD